MAEREDESLPPVTPPPGPARPPAALGAPHRAFGADPDAQLRWAQKIETLGRLTARVVHEINNQASLMLLRTTALLERGEGAVADRHEIEALHRSAERIAGLMRQWLTLGRRGASVPRPFDLNALLAEMAGAVDVVLGETIALVADFRANPAWVRADRGQVEQVILNLVINARDAMAGSGTLTLRTANADLNERADDYLLPFVPGPHVLLAVRDSGCGMDRATLARIFEPYFTTKAPGKGSGLGLHTVWEIVRESGGTLQVSSTPGLGSIFAVYLPQAREAAETPPAPARAGPRPTIATVLIVEDEDSVRALLREVLSRQGYTVLEAPDGRAALTLAASYRGAIDLLVSDCRLPYLTGGELARRLRGLFPALQVLYVSGYPPTEAALPGDLEPSAPFLQKPFTPAALTSQVREMLAARGEPSA